MQQLNLEERFIATFPEFKALALDKITMQNLSVILSVAKRASWGIQLVRDYILLTKGSLLMLIYHSKGKIQFNLQLRKANNKIATVMNDCLELFSISVFADLLIRQANVANLLDLKSRRRPNSRKGKRNDKRNKKS